MHLQCLTSSHSIQDYESEEKFSISDDRISHLLPTSYQDMIVRVYSRKPDLVGETILTSSLMTLSVASIICLTLTYL